MPAGLLDPQQFQAARDLCRRVDPDVYFAAHFLPAERRGAVYAVAAMVEQLRDIVTPRPEQTAVCANDPTVAPQSCTAEAQAGCSSCGGETPEQRRHVCSMVLEFLYGGEKTGKPELDGFSQIASTHGLTRDLFEAVAEGMTLLVHTKRIATWKKQRGAMDQVAGSLAVASLRIAGLTGDVAAGLEPQVRAWAVGVELARLLPRVGLILKDGRVPLPLDDVFRAGLSEADLCRFAAEGTHGDDPRWTALMKGQCDRARSLMSGGEACLPRLSGAPGRAAAVLGRIERGRVERYEARGYPLFSSETGGGLWSRLAKLTGAVGLLSRKSRGARQDLSRRDAEL